MKSLIAITIALCILIAGCSATELYTNDAGDLVDQPVEPDLVTASPIPEEIREVPTPTPVPDRIRYTDDGVQIIYVGAFSGGSYEIEDSFAQLEKIVGIYNIFYSDSEYEARIIDYGDSSGYDAMYRLNTDIL